MTFAAPFFLLAALAAAIPVVLHMNNRQKAKELPFSTLRFLKISVQKTRRRKRIHDILLMVLRASLLLLIAGGLARPAMTNLSSLWGGAHSAAVIVLDNSASMGTVDQDRIRFDTATSAAGQILDQLGDGDQVAVLLTCGPIFPNSDKLERTQDTVRQVLSQCRVSYERANIGLKIQQARKLLADADATTKQIYVLCDMQKLSWEGFQKGTGAEGQGAGKEEKGKDKDAKDKDAKPSETSNADSEQPAEPENTVIVVDCNRTPKPNVAVQGVALEAVVPVAGLPVKATATMLNASTVPLKPRVELLIDGTKEASSPELNAAPGERVKHEFQFTFKTGGLHRGEVRMVGEDGNKYDDRRFFTMEVEQGIPVAIVRSQRHEIPYLDDGYYLEQSLSAGRSGSWAVQPTPLVTNDLLGESLDKYKVIFMVNMPAVSSEIAERLRAYAANGGNVFWIAGDNVDVTAYNQMNETAKRQLLPAALLDVRAPGPQDNRDSWHISFLDKKYPALRHLVEPTSLYESVLVYKHVRMATSEGEGRVLARLDDGEPLLVMRNVEKGKVLMLGSTVHVTWSNLPLRPIFLPLIARMTFELAQVEQTFHNALAGQPLVLQFPEQTEPIGVDVLPPAGGTLRLKTEGVAGQVGQTFRYPDTHETGVYVLQTMNGSRQKNLSYSVNLDPDEADPAKLEHEELEKLFSPTPVVFAENPDDLTSTFTMLREGKSLWGLFLTAVLVGLVCETFVSNCLSPKKEEQTDEHQPPPGMRRLAKKGQ